MSTSHLEFKRVAVDATCWTNSRGYGRHARELLSALARIDTQNQYCFFVDSEDTLEQIPPSVSPVLVRTGVPAAQSAASDGRRAVPDVWRMSRALSQREFHLVLFPSVYSYVPVFSPAHKMVFIHDVIAEKYPEMTVPSLSSRWLWKSKVGLALRQADTIVTVSEYSKQGIVEVFGANPNEIKVVGEAPSPLFRRLEQAETSAWLKERIPEVGRRILYVGGFGPHKNLSSLVEVFARLIARPELSDVSLILVGEYKNEVFHSVYPEIRQLIERIGIEKRVFFTGYLPDDDLVVLLNKVDVLVLPSLLEGLGLPAVEAAACGCPVIATKASPLPGLLGQGGMYIDPLNLEELEEALVHVLGSEALRHKMGAAGLEAAQALTWDRAALALKDLIGSIPS